MANFVYPFNFVPPAGQPPHRDGFHKIDRYKGKTGRIEFTLTNLSPLFIPDSEGTTYYRDPQSPDNNPQYHRVMDFFNVDGRLAIPGTSLKGMIRSVAETLSNSSFGVFTPPGEKFKFRKVTDLGGGVNDLRRRLWGRWTRDGTVQPLKSAKIWRESFDQAYNLTGEEERGSSYSHLRNQKSEIDVKLWQLHTGAEHVREFDGHIVFDDAMTLERSGELHRRKGTERRGELGSKSEIHQKGHPPLILGPPIAPILQALGIKRDDPGPWPVRFKAVLNVPTVRNRNIAVRQERVCWIRRVDAQGKLFGNPWQVREHSRRVLLWPRNGWEDMTDEQRAQSHYIAALYPTGTPLPVTEDAKQAYKASYPKCDLPKPDEIVRYYADNNEVVEFGPAAMFKTPEKATVGDIAGQTPHILPRTASTSLCPASRLFGWTPEEDIGQDEEDIGQDNEQSPVAGRVRVSVAWADKTLNNTRLLPLQILGSPKPQYYPFYLRPQSGDPSTLPAYYAMPQGAGGWWHTPGLLRGRKFYLHHPDTVYEPQAPARPECAPTNPDAACDRVQITEQMVKEAHEKQQRGEAIRPEDLRTNQNATAAILPPGSEFKGYIEFESLSDYELGLLLWAISLSDLPLDGSAERAHKLGMGRPIGMGSMRLKVDRIATWDPVGGWRDDNDAGEQEMTREEAARLVKVFKTWMLTGQETADDAQVARFDNEEFYQDLCDVLSLSLAGNDSVQYHPPGMNPYEGYNYFVEQRQKRNHGQEQPLQTPRDLRRGIRQT